MHQNQLSLLGPPAPAHPAGFKYRAEFMTPAEEQALAAGIAALPFQPFDFHGYKGNRRVVSFGWRYDFSRAKLEAAPPVPDFLRALGGRLGVLGMDPASIEHVLVNEYAPGAGIGWHKDKAVFDQVVGISLLSPCRFRLRRAAGEKWERYTADVAPRSAYLLEGPARWEWEHSVPPLETLRYSITFRNMRQKA